MLRPTLRAVVPVLLTALLALGASAATREEVRVVPAARDATLIEDAGGAFANGSGPALFAGRTGQAQGSVRRALLAFDLAAHLPRRARITGAELTLFVEPGNPSSAPLGLHRVLSAWSEGPSAAAGGRGVPAGAGDATWIHRVWPTSLWQVPGGDLAPAASAAATPPAAGPVTWSATPAMLRDLQLWLEDPARNHGWAIRGDEASPSTAQRLASREHPDPALRPRLAVTFARRDTQCGEAGLAGAALGLCHAWCEALDCDAATTRASDRACDAVARAFARRHDGPLPCAVPDRDADGVPDDADLCPDVPDPGQGDADGDAVGDACDNCPAVANPDQADTFGALGIGDACDCPCFTEVDVAGLVLELDDPGVYRDLQCIDTRVGVKPLTALRAVRADGDDCGSTSADCSALAVTFTEDRVCAWNPPAPAPPLTVQGLSDPQREACRVAILGAARGAGLTCQ